MTWFGGDAKVEVVQPRSSVVAVEDLGGAGMLQESRVGGGRLDPPQPSGARLP